MSTSAFLGGSRQGIQELSQRNLTSCLFTSMYHDNQMNPAIEFCREIHQNWDLFVQTQHDNNPNIPIISWASDRFLACEPKQLQHKLFAQQMQSLQAQLLNTSSPSDKLRLHSCSGTGAAAFLRVPASYPGCFFTNQEFIIAIKIRIKAPLQLLLPSTCICGSSLDDFGDHLFKCRIGGEWDHRHSVLVHLMASIFRSVQLPVQHEVPLQNLGPLRELDTTGTGRMDLIITYSDLPPTLADVTVTHPSSSQLLCILPRKLKQGNTQDIWQQQEQCS